MLDYRKPHRTGYHVLFYDKACLGSKSYLKLADEFLLKKNLNVESAA